jgi:hypothetical protein
VAERNGSTTNVHFALVNAKLLHHCQRLGSKGFVEFKQINVLQTPSGFFNLV